jgi:hypothetical protein
MYKNYLVKCSENIVMISYLLDVEALILAGNVFLEKQEWKPTLRNLLRTKNKENSLLSSLGSFY